MVVNHLTKHIHPDITRTGARGSTGLPSLARPITSPLFTDKGGANYSPEEIQRIVHTLSEYNIEITIRSRHDKTRIFVFREGQGNLKTGLTVCDRVLKEKLGVDLSRLLDSLG